MVGSSNSPLLRSSIIAAFAALNATEEVQRPGEVGGFAGGAVAEDLSDDAQDVVFPFFGREVKLDLIGEKDEADFVAF